MPGCPDISLSRVGSLPQVMLFTKSLLTTLIMCSERRGLVCISVSAVTAAYGSALTAGHFWKSAKSNQKRFAPPLGTSLRLGVPSLRHCSVGPPRRAIHGPARLSRHPCRDAHCAMPAFGQRGLTGRPDQDQEPKQEQERGTCRPYVVEPPLSRASSLPQWACGEHKTHEHPRSPVGASLLAMPSAHPTSPQTDPPPSRASPLPQEERGPNQEPGRLSGRLAVDVDLGRPVNHAG